MLVWSVGQAILLASASHVRHPGALQQVLLIVCLTVLGGAIAGGVHWGLGRSPLTSSPPLRMIAGTVAAMLFLIGFTVAASQGEPDGPWSRVTRSTFLLSTLFLSVVAGWIIARDPFGLAPATDRVYLTPTEYDALPPAERERLRLDSDSPAEAGS